MNDDEEIVNPAVGQRVLDWLLTIALAERFRLHMWVRGRVTVGRGMRICGDHLVRARLAEVAEVQHDFERSEVHFLQFDRAGGHTERALLEIKLDRIEVGFQGFEVVHELAHGSTEAGSTRA